MIFLLILFRIPIPISETQILGYLNTEGRMLKKEGGHCPAGGRPSLKTAEARLGQGSPSLKTCKLPKITQIYPVRP